MGIPGVPAVSSASSAPGVRGVKEREMLSIRREAGGLSGRVREAVLEHAGRCTHIFPSA